MVAAAEKIGVDLPELLRFGLVGGANTALSYGVYSFFLWLGMPYYVALVFDYLSAICFSLFANKRFTFKSADSVGLDTFLKMAGSYLAMFIVNEGLLHLTVAIAGMNPYVAQAGATVLIALLSFLLQKFFVFRRRKASDAQRLSSRP